MEWSFVTWLIDKLLPLLKFVTGRGALPRDRWVPNLNELFRKQAEIFGPYRHEPIIQLEGELSLNTDLTGIAVREREILTKDPNKSNDPHAVLAAPPNWNDDPLHFHAKTLDFASVRALRDKTLNDDPLPQVLSANVLLICRKNQELILHRRASDSDTLKDKLHTIGGAYWPPNFDGSAGDRLRLRNTATREAGEESDVAFSFDENPPMVVFHELETGFIQLAFLGVNISAKEALNLKPNWEGPLVRIAFSELPRMLRHEQTWTATGKAAVLAWLALGAPNGGWNPKFCGIKPTKLFLQEVGAIDI